MEPHDPRLSAYLLDAAARPFAWGSADCWLFAADWCRLARGVDPAARVRGRYRTRLGAARLARRLGGLEAMARDDMAACGIVATDAPRPGDVGLVRDPVTGPVFAVRTAVGWVARAGRGLAAGPAAVIVAWRV